MFALPICLVFIILQCESRLVFPKGSDVGYIVSDPVKELDREEDELRPISQLTEEQLLLSRQTRAGGQSSGSLYNDLWYPPTLKEKKENNGQAESASTNSIASLADEKHGIKMGESNVHCDDALHNLELDWDFSPANYTCYTPRNALPPPSETEYSSVLTCNPPADDYSPQHFCMNDTIQYPERIPSFGDHRPLWPQFGEYKFVPPQRWLHNIEHGAVVMLYHPCTQPHLVAELRTLVQDCLYKHVITPYTPLEENRPLALVAWGCTLEMSSVNETEVHAFIREKALKGPEGLYRKQGTFTEGLLTPSQMPQGYTDKDMLICT